MCAGHLTAVVWSSSPWWPEGEFETHTRIEIADSYRRSLELSRTGIVVGPSAGFALAGLLQYLRRRKSDGSLGALRESNGGIHCVFICPDSPIPYLEEYFKYLDESDFPSIRDEALLLNKPA